MRVLTGWMEYIEKRNSLSISSKAISEVISPPPLAVAEYQILSPIKVETLHIKLLESPIPPAPAPSQKAHFDNISGTKLGTIDPLVSK